MQTLRCWKNIVAVTLRRKYGDGSYFWNSRNAEVDFVIPEENWPYRFPTLWQSPDTFQRETDGLIKLSSVQNVKRMIVVTKDEEDIVEKDGCRIEIIPLWKWLLESLITGKKAELRLGSPAFCLFVISGKAKTFFT